MEQKETLKERWEKTDKKVLGGLVLGIFVGAIIVKAQLKVEVKVAGAEGYSQGVRDFAKAIIDHDIQVKQF